MAAGDPLPGSSDAGRQQQALEKNAPSLPSVPFLPA